MVDETATVENEEPALDPIDPADASELIEGLTRLETALKDEGVSLVTLLRKLAHNVEGIRL